MFIPGHMVFQCISYRFWSSIGRDLLMAFIGWKIPRIHGSCLGLVGFHRAEWGLSEGIFYGIYGIVYGRWYITNQVGLEIAQQRIISQCCGNFNRDTLGLGGRPIVWKKKTYYIETRLGVYLSQKCLKLLMLVDACWFYLMDRLPSGNQTWPNGKCEIIYNDKWCSH